MLNEEETDQTGRESLQEPITANGSQLSAQSDAPSHSAFSPGRKKKKERGWRGGRERQREGDGVQGMERAQVISKGDGEEEREVAAATVGVVGMRDNDRKRRGSENIKERLQVEMSDERRDGENLSFTERLRKQALRKNPFSHCSMFLHECLGL